MKVKRLTKETAELRTELAGLKAGLSNGKGEAGAEKWGEAGQVVWILIFRYLFVCPGYVSAVFTLNFLIPIQVLGSLQEQREAIAELRSMIEYQVGLASLVLTFGLHSYIPLP